MLVPPKAIARKRGIVCGTGGLKERADGSKNVITVGYQVPFWSVPFGYCSRIGSVPGPSNQYWTSAGSDPGTTVVEFGSNQNV